MDNKNSESSTAEQRLLQCILQKHTVMNADIVQFFEESKQTKKKKRQKRKKDAKHLTNF